MVTIADHGLSLRVPSGWEARMWVPDLPPPAINLPVVRLTNDAMPVTRNTYAVEESEKLRRSQVVASLVEFDPSLADVGLYEPQGVPEFGHGFASCRPRLDGRSGPRPDRGGSCSYWRAKPSPSASPWRACSPSPAPAMTCGGSRSCW